MPSAIVLDGHQRSALATTRSLGKLGYRVIVGESTQHSLAGSSRHCSRSVVYPDPSMAPDAFVAWLGDFARTEHDAVLLPMTDVTVPLVLRHSFPQLRTALPSLAAYETASDKYKLFDLARQLDVRVPRTFRLRRGEFVAAHVTNMRFPIVIKPRVSALRTNEGILKRTVRYAHSAEGAAALIEEMLVNEEDEVLLQEYVEGVGEGTFALYDRGKPVFFFAHRRLREKPPSGGVSVLCESVLPNKEAVRAARAILDSLQWHGAAMVEFKVDPNGVPWLIEINARFWGSLQLAVDAGADFPRLIYELATGKTVESVPRLHVGRKLRWLLGDLDNLYATLKHKQFAPTFIDKVTAVGRFCIPWQPGLRYELMRLSDPRPGFFAFSSYIEALKKQ